MKILNIGSGYSYFGTDRIDINKTPQTTKVADVEKGLPYKSNYFDIVFTECLFEHLKNPNELLKEIYRVLKKGGQLILITDNAGFILYHHNLHGVHHGNYTGLFDSHNPNDRHYALYTEEHLKNHLGSVGFKKSRVKYVYTYSKKEPKRVIQVIFSSLLGKRLGMPRLEIRGLK